LLKRRKPNAVAEGQIVAPTSATGIDREDNQATVVGTQKQSPQPKKDSNFVKTSTVMTPANMDGKGHKLNI
jgi:hypothetical protein